MKKLYVFLVMFGTLKNLAAQAGNVGIGTTAPQARLHVLDSSVLLSAANDIPATAGNTPVSGAGRRMMWYPAKAAFRVGYVNGSQWDALSIGKYSFAAGRNCIASGEATIAMGDSAQATGAWAMAIGNHAYARGSFSNAIGYRNHSFQTNTVTLGSGDTAFASFSIALGYECKTNGTSSAAIGVSSVADGINSVAIGVNNNASGYYSTAMGYQTISNGYNGFVIGRYNDTIVASQTLPTSTSPLFIIGNGTNEFSRKNVLVVNNSGNMGIGINIPAARLHVTDSSVLFSAEDLPPGSPTNPPVSGEGRRMMWYADKAAFRAGYVINNFWNKDSIGIYSIAAGFNVKAKGIAAAAFNYQSEAMGNYSSAFGNSIANGVSSLAAGFISNANGAYSNSFGIQNHANGYGSFVVGQYSDSVVTRQPNAISQTQQTPLFIIGNGTDPNNRNNAMVVNVNGYTGINTSTPGANMDINGDLAYRQNVITLVNGLNSNIDVGKFSFVKITGPNTNFSIDGIQGGVEGKILTLYNLTGSSMLIVDQSGSSSSVANRINTLEGGVSISTVGNGSVTLQYSTADNRWMVIGFKE
ncbi:MAG: hypothetical protein JNM88_17110 [Chitinophagaceae bacterium]|nr:hypothetical protein [Chitinophagaceae bacterium]